MIHSIIPSAIIMRDPAAPYRVQNYPRAIWQGIPVTLRGDAINTVLSSDPRDYLRIGPCSTVSRFDR